MKNVRLAMIGLALLVSGLLGVAQTPQPAPAARGQAPAAGQAGRQGGGRAGGPAGRGGGGRGQQGRPRKALLAWADTRNGQAQHAFTSHALAIVERLGYESGLWDTFIRTDSNIVADTAFKTDGTPASGGPSLSNTDGIFFLGHREIDINPKQREELLAYVRSGHGFVAAHTGLTAFESWPEFGEMLGAQYEGHLYTGPGQVINEQPAFPAVRHFGPTFNYTDEFYKAKTFSRDKIDVLLRFNPSSVPGTTLAKDGDFPLAWAKNYGQGRVFYGSFSHDATSWDIRDIQLMYFEAIKWSLGLTDAPVQPHKMTAAPTAAPTSAPTAAPQ
jgi:type 1 glutamine amidotransferase